jgi:cytochrome c biogenesis protein CcmG/thiol:disulfide interchange protein DsbE
MKLKTIIGALVITAIFLSAAIPNVTLKNLKGQEVSTSTLIGKDSLPTIVLFWATWCHPCIKELEAINEKLPEWQEKYKFNLVCVSVDDARTSNRVASFVNGKAWDMEVLLDVNSDFKRAMNISNVPSSLVFDKEGNIIYNHTSYASGDEDELEKLLEKLSK